MGSYHPRHKNLYYPVNYGYVDGVVGGDGEDQDIYLLGETAAGKTRCSFFIEDLKIYFLRFLHLLHGSSYA